MTKGVCCPLLRWLVSSHYWRDITLGACHQLATQRAEPPLLLTDCSARTPTPQLLPLYHTQFYCQVIFILFSLVMIVSGISAALIYPYFTIQNIKSNSCQLCCDGSQGE